MRLTNPTSLKLDELLPEAAFFSHQSIIHGRAHVARVMIHAFLLTEMCGFQKDAGALWAAAFIHDLARLHDGLCLIHGAEGVKKFKSRPDIQQRLAGCGLTNEHYAAIYTAVDRHSIPEEIPINHPHRRLTALLKDADGLDRVRIGDLDPSYLRFPQSLRLTNFALQLYQDTPRDRVEEPDFFQRIWAIACRLLA